MAETLILNRPEIKALVSPQEALEPMREAFRLYSTQRMVPALRVSSPLPAPAPSDAGAMILLPGVVAGIPAYTVKVHAKYPERDPAIQGVIILSSLETGETLAIMESGFLTAVRTGLAGAIGADVLARPDARTVAIVGAGVQGILHLEMLLLVRPITRARVYDILYTAFMHCLFLISVTSLFYQFHPGWGFLLLVFSVFVLLPYAFFFISKNARACVI